MLLEAMIHDLRSHDPCPLRAIKKLLGMTASHQIYQDQKWKKTNHSYKINTKKKDQRKKKTDEKKRPTKKDRKKTGSFVDHFLF